MTILRVAPAVGVVTTGTLSLYDGGVLLGALPVHNGARTFVTNMLASGDHQITVVYSGSSTDLTSSTTTALTQQVH